MKHKLLITFILAFVASIGTMFGERVLIGDLYYDLNTTNQTAKVAANRDASGVIIIPASVTYNEVEYTVTSIGYSAFNSCTGLTAVTIGNGVISIDNEAFFRCTALTTLMIPNSVTSIGRSAFNGCSGLNSIEVENGNTVYDSRNNCNAIIETATNMLIVGCKNTTIPHTVTGIGYHAFYECVDLISVTIPNSVKSIGDSAFWGCHGLTSVTIGSGIENIEDFAFYDCNGLTSITCEAINPPSMSLGIFYNVNYSIITLYVPEESIDTYKAADYWKNFANIQAINEEAVPAVYSSPVNPSQKLIRDGQLLILRDGHTYTLTSQEIK